MTAVEVLLSNSFRLLNGKDPLTLWLNAISICVRQIASYPLLDFDRTTWAKKAAQPTGLVVVSIFGGRAHGPQNVCILTEFAYKVTAAFGMDSGVRSCCIEYGLGAKSTSTNKIN